MSKLTLKRIDNDTTCVLNIGGEVSEKHTMEVSSLPVLYTGQPLTKYQYSGSSYSISGAKLYNNDASVQAEYDWLVAATKPLKDTNEPPIVNLTWLDLTIGRIYVTEVSIVRKMSLEGTLTLADVDLSFIIVPVEPKPKLAPVTPASVSTNGIKLSDREQKEYADKVVAKLKTDTKKATELEFKPTSVVKVDALGNVVVDGRKSGTLRTLGIEVKASATPAPVKDTKVIPTTNKPTGVTKKV